jgi:hypothetical protein
MAIRLALPALCICDGTKPSYSHSGERVQENDLFINCHPTRSVSYGTKTTRKPALLLRLSGSLALRLAIRQLTALLFHEPPRNTRNVPSIISLFHFDHSLPAEWPAKLSFYLVLIFYPAGCISSARSAARPSPAGLLHLIQPARLTDTGRINYGTKTTRKPALASRLSGTKALRRANRQSTAPSTHEPPRNTRKVASLKQHGFSTSPNSLHLL